jgi:AcrR family transcriptional regulator
MGGLRDRHKARTRAGIAQAALRLFRKQGFEATTVEEIALAAEVSPRTFFRYFPSKEAAAFPDHERRLARLEELLLAHAAQPPLQRVRSALLGIARELERERCAVVAWQKVVEGSPALLAQERVRDLAWEEAIARALGAGALGTDADRRARLAAGALFGAIRAVLRTWYARAGQVDLPALGEEAFALLRSGLGEWDRFRPAVANHRGRRVPRKAASRTARAPSRSASIPSREPSIQR